MRKFYRVTEQEMKTLEVYMDPDIREEVHSRFAPCSNEEFLSQVFIRNGITAVQISEVLNVDVEEVAETFIIIESIKGVMSCNNNIQRMRIENPGRDFATEISWEGDDYRWNLHQYGIYKKRLEVKAPYMLVLSDLDKDFPEIDFTYLDGYLFYTWNNELL